MAPGVIEHAPDLMSKYSVSSHGQTSCERWEGKKVSHETAEFGQKTHFEVNKKDKPRDEKLEAERKQGYFLGNYWRTGEAIASTDGGVMRVASIRLAGARRRRDQEGLNGERGRPWERALDEGEGRGELRTRLLIDEAKSESTEDACPRSAH